MSKVVYLHKILLQPQKCSPSLFPTFRVRAPSICREFGVEGSGGGEREKGRGNKEGRLDLRSHYSSSCLPACHLCRVECFCMPHCSEQSSRLRLRHQRLKMPKRMSVEWNGFAPGKGAGAKLGDFQLLCLHWRGRRFIEKQSY